MLIASIKRHAGLDQLRNVAHRHGREVQIVAFVDGMEAAKIGEVLGEAVANVFAVSAV